MLRSTIGALPSGSATAMAMLRSWTSRPMLRTFFIGPASFCGSTHFRMRNPRLKGVLVHPSCLRPERCALRTTLRASCSGRRIFALSGADQLLHRVDHVAGGEAELL